MTSKTLFCAVLLLLLPAIAQAADFTGVPKIREGDQIQIGNSRIRLGGIDAPSVSTLCPCGPTGHRDRLEGVRWRENNRQPDDVA
jgi:endonuclease YncB( thermonuclease family)